MFWHVLAAKKKWENCAGNRHPNPHGISYISYIYIYIIIYIYPPVD